MAAIPEFIISYAKSVLAEDNIHASFEAERLGKARDEALRAIEYYKDLKKRSAKHQEQKKELQNWLQTVQSKAEEKIHQ